MQIKYVTTSLSWSSNFENLRGGGQQYCGRKQKKKIHPTKVVGKQPKCLEDMATTNVKKYDKKTRANIKQKAVGIFQNICVFQSEARIYFSFS